MEQKLSTGGYISTVEASSDTSVEVEVMTYLSLYFLVVISSSEAVRRPHVSVPNAHSTRGEPQFVYCIFAPVLLWLGHAHHQPP
jgi:hypothetical protein